MNAGDNRSNEADLLDQILSSGRDSERPQTNRTVDGLVREALKGTTLTRPEVSAAIEKAIAAVENDITQQLLLVIHHPAFQALESSWRGVFELVRRMESDSLQKIRLFNLSTSELVADLVSAQGIEATSLGRKLAALSGEEDDEPFTVLLEDHDLTNQSDPISVLQRLGSLGLVSRTLIVATGSPSLCGLRRWGDLDDDDIILGTGLNADQKDAWQAFRESQAAGAILLAVPRILARSPYGPDSSAVEEFSFRELGSETQSVTSDLIDRLPWMSAVYMVGAMLAERFSDESADEDSDLSETGARAGRLNSFLIRDEDGDFFPVGPAEVALSRRRETELRAWGFAPLQQSREGDTLVLNRFQTPYLTGLE